MVSKLRCIVPWGGKFPNHNRWNYGPDYKKEEFYLLDLAPHEARDGDSDISMGGTDTPDNDESAEMEYACEEVLRSIEDGADPNDMEIDSEDEGSLYEEGDEE